MNWAICEKKNSDDNNDIGTITITTTIIATTTVITQQEAALQKLKVKQCVDLCRRRVAYYEWKRTMLQMTMEDYNFFLKRIEKCSVCMSRRSLARPPWASRDDGFSLFDAHECITPFKSFRFVYQLFGMCKYMLHSIFFMFMQITKDVKLWLNDKFESKTKKKLDRSVKKADDLDNVAVPNTKNALLVIHAQKNEQKNFEINCIRYFWISELNVSTRWNV